MNIRKIAIGCVVILIGAAAVYLYIQLGGKRDDDPVEKTKRVVEMRYTNDETGMIHAYLDKMDSQYLSESAGLYMEYLVKANDKEAFATFFDAFKKPFLMEKDGHLFIKWELKKDTHVNALIDDLRIAAALDKAAELFSEPVYASTAKQIVGGIRNNQFKDGIPADFYDWKYGEQAQRITLSYLTGEFFRYFAKDGKGQELLQQAYSEDETFFPEYYDMKKQEYIAQPEVHMVDQLLIASNRMHVNIQSPDFLSWLKANWQQKQKIYGRYARDSGKPAVKYESLAVYYYMQQYLDQAREPDMAEAVRDRMKKIAPARVGKDSHFFDYMHSRLMLLE